MSAAPPVRPAATVLLLRDDPFEVLMVRRAAAGSFPSALVFPGGSVDPADAADAWLPLVAGAEGLDAGERGLRIAALRESFEEVGLFVAADARGRAIPPPARDTRDFREIVAASGGRLPLDALVHFGRWITPETQRKRWDTHFFLARAPAGQAAACDEREIVAAAWHRPADALALPDLPVPTRLNLKRLAESEDVAAALAAAIARPRFTVLARIAAGPAGAIMHIPIEAGYGTTEIAHPTG